MQPNMSKDEMKLREREMKKKLNEQTRALDREIYNMQRMKKQAQDKLKKELAKGPKADNFSKKTYARQMLQCTKKIDQYNLNKAKVKNMEYQIDGMLANMKMTQVIGQAGMLMGQVNKQLNIQGATQAMTKFQEQMMKMQLTTQMLDEAMDMNNDDIDIDEQAEKLLHDMELNVQTGFVKKQQQAQNVQSEQDKLLQQFQKKMANY